MGVLALPKTSKNDAIQRVAQIADNTTGFVYFSEHCEMRMLERGISRKQILRVLRSGELIGKVEWDIEEERGWKMKLKRISAGAEIRVVAKLVERDSECVVAVTTF